MNDSSASRTHVRVLRPQVKWEDLYFYKKTVVLDQLTFVFCQRFLPKYGDRTVDQMVQAARSGKQNIVEGFADGVTSTEMELKLLNVARASLKELKEDYLDYLRRHSLALWDAKHSRYDGLLKFCREHNELVDYQPFFNRWTVTSWKFDDTNVEMLFVNCGTHDIAATGRLLPDGSLSVSWQFLGGIRHGRFTVAAPACSRSSK